MLYIYICIYETESHHCILETKKHHCKSTTLQKTFCYTGDRITGTAISWALQRLVTLSFSSRVVQYNHLTHTSTSSPSRPGSLYLTATNTTKACTQHTEGCLLQISGPRTPSSNVHTGDMQARSMAMGSGPRSRRQGEACFSGRLPLSFCQLSPWTTWAQDHWVACSRGL